MCLYEGSMHIYDTIRIISLEQGHLYFHCFNCLICVCERESLFVLTIPQMLLQVVVISLITFPISNMWVMEIATHGSYILKVVIIWTNYQEPCFLLCATGVLSHLSFDWRCALLTMSPERRASITPTPVLTFDLPLTCIRFIQVSLLPIRLFVFSFFCWEKHLEESIMIFK